MKNKIDKNKGKYIILNNNNLIDYNIKLFEEDFRKVLETLIRPQDNNYINCIYNNHYYRLYIEEVLYIYNKYLHNNINKDILYWYDVFEINEEQLKNGKGDIKVDNIILSYCNKLYRDKIVIPYIRTEGKLIGGEYNNIYIIKLLYFDLLEENIIYTSDNSYIKRATCMNNSIKDYCDNTYIYVNQDYYNNKIDINKNINYLRECITFEDENPIKRYLSDDIKYILK